MAEADPHPKDEWRIETNARYNGIVATIISLATGSLVLPALFLREFLGIPKEKALLPFLNGWAYAAWISFALSILTGLAYAWLSIKWIKIARGQKIAIPEGVLECLLDTIFVGVAILFLVGTASLVLFLVTIHA